jgi:uncharacterized protein (TIGR02599 family)
MNFRISPSGRGGFTLVEVLVSTALVVLIMSLLLTTVDQTQKIWTRARSKAVQFQAARTAFDAVSRRLAQATLNTYWRAQDGKPQAEFADFAFRRQGEFQFISGPTQRIFGGAQAVSNLNTPVEESYPGHAVFFHAPLGLTEEPIDGDPAQTRRFRMLDNLMVGCGYFVEFGDDPDLPKFLADQEPAYPERKRYRLMEMTVPAERLNIYDRRTDDSRVSDPRIFGVNDQPYGGLVDTSRRPISAFVRPYWMKEALLRETASGENRPTMRFKYARVMAENIVGLILLPKLPERDRVIPGTTTVDPNQLELAPFMEYDSWRLLTTVNMDARDQVSNAQIDNRVRENILPPVVQLTMIALDEPTASRLRDAGKETLPATWLAERFRQRIDTVQKFDQEMQALVEDIQQASDSGNPDRVNFKINYRIFTTDVVIRGSKWSRDPNS